MTRNKDKKEMKKGIGILAKLIISFLALSCIPLVVLGYIADTNLAQTGRQAVQKAVDLGSKSLVVTTELGQKAIQGSVRALDEKSTEAIELRTVELAQRIADFLYERDKDILLFAELAPEADIYLNAYQSCFKDVVVPGPCPSQDAETGEFQGLTWRNPENRASWRHRPPLSYTYEKRPLYKEITFIDLNGHERIKISEGAVSKDFRDVSKKENTYCKAEDYYSHLGRLARGQIYVSRVIGPRVKGWLVKTPEGIRVRQDSAYAGKENPCGKPFEGIVRWATPVYGPGGEKIGYVSAALDHTHIMEFTDHVVPTEERFSGLSNAGSGNYAFLWDDQDQCISHARDFFICGYDPETGEEVPGWVSQETYDRFRKSGMDFREFVEALPPFQSFSMSKAGSKEQLESGDVALDCRVLDTAPQCQGWHRGSDDGGSGSFLIFWSGLWKLTTYAAVPYYTGLYGDSKRGFGYVTIGANVDDFHRAANTISKDIEESIRDQSKDIDLTTQQTRALIKENSARNRRLITLITVVSALLVIGASVLISLRITRPLKRLAQGAIAMSRGELNQSIPVKSGDEVGQLAASFNKMAAAVSEVDRMKSEFVTIASHELRTPIHAMLLGVSGLLEGYAGEINEEVREDLMLVQEGIERLTRIVNSLLDLSRIESRKTEMVMEKTDMREVVERSVQQVSELAQEYGHTILKRLPEHIPLIEADRDRSIQVVVNLLSNAIKYTPNEGTIIVGLEAHEKEVVLSVADNGYGIPGWAHKKVFEKFFQADSITSQRVGGSGLGLAITKGIVEAHGGTITCESPLEEGKMYDLVLGGERKGTAFIVHLPVNGTSDLNE